MTWQIIQWSQGLECWFSWNSYTWISSKNKRDPNNSPPFKLRHPTYEGQAKIAKNTRDPNNSPQFKLPYILIVHVYKMKTTGVKGQYFDRSWWRFFQLPNGKGEGVYSGSGNVLALILRPAARTSIYMVHDGSGGSRDVSVFTCSSFWH